MFVTSLMKIFMGYMGGGQKKVKPQIYMTWGS